MRWLIEPDFRIKWEIMQFWKEAVETNGELSSG